MKNAIPNPDSHQELREALRALCAGFGPSYWQGISRRAATPSNSSTP